MALPHLFTEPLNKRTKALSSTPLNKIHQSLAEGSANHSLQAHGHGRSCKAGVTSTQAGLCGRAVTASGPTKLTGRPFPEEAAPLTASPARRGGLSWLSVRGDIPTRDRRPSSQPHPDVNSPLHPTLSNSRFHPSPRRDEAGRCGLRHSGHHRRTAQRTRKHSSGTSPCVSVFRNLSRDQDCGAHRVPGAERSSLQWPGGRSSDNLAGCRLRLKAALLNHG